MFEFTSKSLRNIRGSCHNMPELFRIILRGSIAMQIIIPLSFQIQIGIISRKNVYFFCDVLIQYQTLKMQDYMLIQHMHLHSA